jgi:hypothetical protein
VQPKLLSPRTPSKPNRVTRLSVAAGSQLPARLLLGVPPRRQPPVVGPRPPRCYQGVPLMSQPKRWPLMILQARLARQGARVSPQKRPTAAALWILRSSWGTPMLRSPGVVSLDEAMGAAQWRLPRPRTCSTRSVVASSMNNDACCCGLPCSRSGQRRRGQGRRLGSNTLTLGRSY